jgi:hypothetical protein
LSTNATFKIDKAVKGHVDCGVNVDAVRIACRCFHCSQKKRNISFPSFFGKFYSCNSKVQITNNRRWFSCTCQHVYKSSTAEQFSGVRGPGRGGGGGGGGDVSCEKKRPVKKYNGPFSEMLIIKKTSLLLSTIL